uniref:Ionotropic glutamate receptor L-glutamate and glycine-binding domain-containing protein n=1 Tax=Anopheles epiroticus TaxID=199890 RepID=A0A182PTF7_9DIPT
MMLLLGSTATAVATTSVDRWASCVDEILLQNADIVRHELNLYALGSSGEGTSNFHRDLLDRLLPTVVQRSHFTINLAPYPETVNFNRRNLVLILSDDLSHFNKHLPRLVEKNVEQRGYFLLLLLPRVVGVPSPVVSEQAVAKTFRLLWSVRIHNVVLAVESSSTSEGIDLLGYDPFGPGCCWCSRPKRLAQCAPAAMRQLYDRFERNLYGCQLRIASFERAPFLEFVHPANGTQQPPGRPKLAGIEGNLVELLASQLNFRFTVVQPSGNYMWGRIYPNGSATGAIGMLLDGTVHLTVGGYFPYPALLTATSQSHSYYTTDLVLAVPEELASLSPLEQLLKPFQPAIWVLLALELTLGLLALRRTATLHFWRTVIGESMPDPAIPRRTLTRFILLLWIMHSTLLRECYKGSLVGFLTEANPLADIRSLEVLIRSGYRFAMTETVYHKVFDDASSHHWLHPSQVQLIKSSDRQRLLERTILSRHRLAIAYTREEIIDFNSRNRSNINFRVSDETLLTYHFAMYFKRSSPLAGAFDWYIRRIVATGFVARWTHQSLDLRFERPTLAGTGQAEVLQMHHLHGSYLLLFAGLLLATLAFTLEHAVARWYGRARVARATNPRYPYLHELKQYPAAQRRKRRRQR